MKKTTQNQGILTEKKPVAIVGAGPAGVLAALFLAKAGQPSLLFDKATFPRTKACADILTSNALRVLNDLDPDILPQLAVSNQSLPIGGTLFFAPNGKPLSIDFLSLNREAGVPSCYAIKRTDLDEYLIQRAKSDPLITFHEGTDIRKIEYLSNNISLKSADNQEFTTPLLILANGSNSALGEKLIGITKSPEHFAVGVRGYYRGVKNLGKPGYTELFVLPKLLPGGLYIAPTADGTFNVNVVMRSDIVRKKKLSLAQVMATAIAAHPPLQERFRDAELIGKIEGGGLFLGTKHRKISGNRVLLAGDAAGLIDLISANGIPQAMISGREAAKTALFAVQSGDFSQLHHYDKAVYAAIEKDLKLGRLLAGLMGKNWFLRASAGLLNFLAARCETNPTLRNLLYDEDVTRTLRNPLFYWRLLRASAT